MKETLFRLRKEAKQKIIRIHLTLGTDSDDTKRQRGWSGEIKKWNMNRNLRDKLWFHKSNRPDAHKNTTVAQAQICDIILDYSYRIVYNMSGGEDVEHRVAKVNISAAGGTAARGAKTCKVTLPTAWMDAMGINLNQRELVIAFDGNQITLTRRLAGAEFAKRKLEIGHEVRRIRLYDEEKLCTVIYADFTGREVVAENQAVSTVKTAFGNNPFPNWEDFQEFLAERCIPKQRSGLREYLEAIGLEEYNPLHIVEKTGGRMAEDQQWMTIEVLSCLSEL